MALLSQVLSSRSFEGLLMMRLMMKEVLLIKGRRIFGIEVLFMMTQTFKLAKALSAFYGQHVERWWQQQGEDYQ